MKSSGFILRKGSFHLGNYFDRATKDLFLRSIYNYIEIKVDILYLDRVLNYLKTSFNRSKINNWNELTRKSANSYFQKLEVVEYIVLCLRL